MALGTWVAIEATGEAALQAVEAGFAAVSELDRLMHPDRAGSDLAAIHSTAPGTAVGINRSTGEVLSLARAVHRLSEGVFDPCVPPSRFTDLQIFDGHAGRAPSVICRAPVSLDLGGIAKGFAVDQAVIAMQAAGCPSGLVNAGGDLRVFGPNPHTLFVRKERQAHRIELVEAALAVSDVDAATPRPTEHRGYYARGSTEPALICRYAAVVAPQAAVADALTKCVLLCPPETTAHALEEFCARQITFERERS
jgi:thiamine biosynthesis lipoprotein